MFLQDALQVIWEPLEVLVERMNELHPGMASQAHDLGGEIVEMLEQEPRNLGVRITALAMVLLFHLRIVEEAAEKRGQEWKM